ncbi:MAG: hypothetical protein QOJ85_4714 [Solirubrobacteraceae bacterium]|jgi:hypothetical protein|nr:hypothetical protein [Solirubrobacteraceae bacterium]
MRAEHRQRLGIALFPLGALAMHQLRYELAFGSDASRQLASHGHGYLQALTPLVVLAAALGAGGWLARLARAWRDGEPDREWGRGLAALWALAAAALVCIYVGQESLEALFATGHPHGLAAILGHGGLWALPAAIVIGGLLALVVRGGRALVAHVARTRRRRTGRPAVRAPRHAARPASVTLPGLEPLAGGRAGRAPPVAAVRRGGLRPARA